MGHRFGERSQKTFLLVLLFTLFRKYGQYIANVRNVGRNVCDFFLKELF